MAQTIALYRGELTISSGSISTAFTNSASGTASRLRVAYLSWTSDFATVSAWMSVLVYPSGATYPTIIAASYPSSSLATRHVSGQPVGAYSGMVNSSTANPIFFNPAFFTTNAAFTNSIPAVSSQTNAPGNLLCYNQDTLIGPNDVVKISWFENGGNTRSGIINYSFSTITES